MIKKKLNFFAINDVYTMSKNWKGQGGLSELKTLLDLKQKK